MAVQRELFGIDAGGPAAAIVHQDRLVLVGSGIAPDLVAGSRVGKWDDFRLGVIQDEDEPTQTTPVTALTDPPAAGFVASTSEGFWIQATTARGNDFHALLQQEGLFVFGAIGESVVPPGLLSGRTLEIRENSWYGSERGRTPVIAGGLSIFVQRGGQDLRAIGWNENERKYLAVSMLHQAGDVFRRARDMTFVGSQERDPDLVFVVDEGGDVAVASLPLVDEVKWSRWSFRVDPDEDPPLPQDGKVRAATAPLGSLAFAVERNGYLAIETPAEDQTLQGDETFETTAEPLAEVFIRLGGRTREVHRRPTYEPPADVLAWLRQDSARRVEIEGKSYQLNPVRFRRREVPYATRDGRLLGAGRGATGAYREYPIGTLLVDNEGTPLRWKVEGGENVVGIDRTPLYRFETLPYMELSERGFSRPLRRCQLMEAHLDISLPEEVKDEYTRRLRPTPTTKDERAATVYMLEWLSSLKLEIVGTLNSRERTRIREPRRVAVQTWRDGRPEIIRAAYNGQRAWRDRISQRYDSNTPYHVVGLTYRMLG